MPQTETKTYRPWLYTFLGRYTDKLLDNIGGRLTEIITDMGLRRSYINNSINWNSNNSSNTITGTLVNKLYNLIDKEYRDVDYPDQYLTIESLADNNTISWKASNASLTKTISISTDNGSTWTSKTSSTSGVTLALLNAGDKLLIKGENTAYATLNYYNCFVSTDNFKVYGNIMSLVYGDSFVNQISLTVSHTFRNLFYICFKLIYAENLILPATTLANDCYRSMFNSCSNLTKAPKLPATTLATRCYMSMFIGCTSLTTAPELPATTLAQGCYGSMFYSCTSLTKAPELPATTLAYGCYANMFYSCTSLTTAPELPATTLAQGCYGSMFNSCSNLTKAPELLATTLAERCYASMFRGCTNLNYIKAIFTTTPSTTYTDSWVNGVASTGTFVKNNNATWDVRGDHGIPNDWNIYTEAEYEEVRHYELDSIQKYYNVSNVPTIISDEKINNNVISKILIPIDSSLNYYDNDPISSSIIISYINDNENYLVIKPGTILGPKTTIVESNLIGKGIYSNANILYDYDNNLIKIYSSLPLNLIINDLKYLSLTYYNITMPNLYLWFDDYPSDKLSDIISEDGAENWHEYVNDYLLDDYPKYKGANCFKYTGETIEWNNQEYYVWKIIPAAGVEVNLNNYILTNTIDYTTLYNYSLESDPDNEWCPYIVKFMNDDEYTAANSNDILIAVRQDNVIQDVWIENVANSYGDWDEYCENYLLQPSINYGDSNGYRYEGRTFNWNNTEYYLWTSIDDGNDGNDIYAIITDTINYNELYEKSIESDHYNMVCPYIATFDNDYDLLYESSDRQNDWLIKVVKNNNHPEQAIELYFDDFIIE